MAAHALFVLNVTSTSPSSAGWIGVGPGTRMGNADMLVAWSHNGNWVLVGLTSLLFFGT